MIIVTININFKGLSHKIQSFFVCVCSSFLFLFFLFVVSSVIHWSEKALGSHVFPIPIPPRTSLPTRSLQVLPVIFISNSRSHQMNFYICAFTSFYYPTFCLQHLTQFIYVYCLLTVLSTFKVNSTREVFSSTWFTDAPSSIQNRTWWTGDLFTDIYC